VFSALCARFVTINMQRLFTINMQRSFTTVSAATAAKERKKERKRLFISVFCIYARKSYISICSSVYHSVGSDCGQVAQKGAKAAGRLETRS
jgi:hypothetical protein